MIDGVRVTSLEPQIDERGRLVELFRSDEEECGSFGQVHVTTLFPGVVKGWHRHRRRNELFAVVQGMVRLGLYDDREGSPTDGELNQFFLGVHSPLRVFVPQGVWFGMKAIGGEEAIISVFSDARYDARDPDEERIDPEVNEIPFDWDIKHR